MACMSRSTPVIIETNCFYINQGSSTFLTHLSLAELNACGHHEHRVVSPESKSKGIIRERKIGRDHRRTCICEMLLLICPHRPLWHLCRKLSNLLWNHLYFSTKRVYFFGTALVIWPTALFLVSKGTETLQTLWPGVESCNTWRLETLSWPQC